MTDTYTVSRSIEIAAPPARVYEKIVDFHNWTQWSPWEDVDPDMRRQYAGPAAGAGAAYSWSGNSKAGRGRMEILSAEEPNKITIDLAFEKPFKSRSSIHFDVEPSGEGSRVSWTMHGERTVGIRLMSMVRPMDKMIGPDFEKGLSRLKTVSETG